MKPFVFCMLIYCAGFAQSNPDSLTEVTQEIKTLLTPTSTPLDKWTGFGLAAKVDNPEVNTALVVMLDDNSGKQRVLTDVGMQAPWIEALHVLARRFPEAGVEVSGDYRYTLGDKETFLTWWRQNRDTAFYANGTPRFAPEERLHDRRTEVAQPSSSPEVALAEAQEPPKATSRVKVIDNRFFIPEAGASFTIPKAWLRFSRYFRLDSARLGTVQKETTWEWTYENGTITDGILPFTDCLLHIGNDGWGIQAHVANVQMRAYITDIKPEEITKAVATKGVETAVKVKGRSVKSDSKDEDGWRVDHVGFDLWYRDYGGRAGIYFYSRPCKARTLVLVFMLTEHERLIKDRDSILKSFTTDK